jgi:hypothetical protein
MKIGNNAEVFTLTTQVPARKLLLRGFGDVDLAGSLAYQDVLGLALKLLRGAHRFAWGPREGTWGGGEGPGQLCASVECLISGLRV